MSAALHLRARRMREQSLIRAWKYRQRNYSNGAWFRVRRVLVDARDAWSISVEDGDRLQAKGYLPVEAGLTLAPPKRLFFVEEPELVNLSSRRRIPVRLGTDFLAASDVVLVRFVIPVR